MRNYGGETEFRVLYEFTMHNADCAKTALKRAPICVFDTF